MRGTGHCSTHYSYQARRPPKSNCAQCRKAYEREQKKYKIVGDAAMRLSKLLDCDVSLEARYTRQHGSDSGLKVIIEKTNGRTAS